MKIISWNVNSVRARITNILDYIKQSSPDILLIQDTNATIIVKTVRNDSEEITFSDALQDYSVNFLYGDLKFTPSSEIFANFPKLQT